MDSPVQVSNAQITLHKFVFTFSRQQKNILKPFDRKDQRLGKELFKCLTFSLKIKSIQASLKETSNIVVRVLSLVSRIIIGDTRFF